MGAWSGEHTELRASTLVHWERIRSARNAGYRYYDFDGITQSLATRVLAGEKVKDTRGVEHFKLGFGGDVVLFPPTFDRSYHPLGRALPRLAPKLRRQTKLAQSLLGRRT
jgi:lipid II:glycine glycyltransferase (peptidoglycan interpeptide bridge formation enzyme)